MIIFTGHVPSYLENYLTDMMLSSRSDKNKQILHDVLMTDAKACHQNLKEKIFLTFGLTPHP